MHSTHSVFLLIATLLFCLSCSDDPTSSDEPTLETGSVTDIDGNTYKTVKIGSQWWMAENLKVTHYRNGEAIPNVTNTSEWLYLTSGAYCDHPYISRYVATYGRLYNWYAVDDSRNLAPAGWHVPTDDEWKQLEMHLGMSRSEADDAGFRGTYEGGRLKETGATHWRSPNRGASNSSGFSALPGGGRIERGGFSPPYITANFWTATSFNSVKAWRRELDNVQSDVSRLYFVYSYGQSVRCVKD